MEINSAKALSEFVSTFKEWHYFVGGFSLGFVVGWVIASLFSILIFALV